MSPEEFERLKEQEKAHLRQLRDLKAQHRDVQRKKSIFDALLGMSRPDIDSTHDEQVGKLMQDAAYSEARLDLAMESAGTATGETAAERSAREAEERAALQRAEADALVRQMKQDLQGPMEPSTRGAAAPAAGASGKSIGRAVMDEEETPGAAPPEREAKTLGRPAPPSSDAPS